MQSSPRPMSIWARPVFVGLLALAVLASATVVVAAPNAPQAPIATPSQPAADVTVHASDPAPFGSHIVQPTDVTSLILAAAAAPAPATPAVKAEAKSVTVAKAAPRAKPAPARPKPVTRKPTVSYHGVYHLWIPALGLSRGISNWGCNGGLIPNRVEYWGCAGRHNLYLLGHAWGVFAPIHDGYHSGALKVGLTAWYADTSGKVHRYRISQIRHVANKDYASWSTWAMASSSSQIITLQTCDGPTSAYRILVRLVPA
jgi:hypothetical protein